MKLIKEEIAEVLQFLVDQAPYTETLPLDVAGGLPSSHIVQFCQILLNKPFFHHLTNLFLLSIFLTAAVNI